MVYRCLCCRKDFDASRHKPLYLGCGHLCCKECCSRAEDQGRDECPRQGCSFSWAPTPLSGLRTVFFPDDDALKCGVCYEAYGTPGRLPRLVSCGHVYCEACLKEAFRTASTCPSCAAQQPRAVEALPVLRDLCDPACLSATAPPRRPPCSAEARPTGPKRLQLFVRTTQGRTIAVQVPYGGKVQDIYDKLGKGYADCRMVFGGRTLEAHMPMAHYDLHKDATVQLTCRLKGGRCPSCALLSG